MLESRFEKAFSSDRVFAQIIASAGGNFDRVPSKDRREVMSVSAVLFVQRFVEINRNDLLVYCPSRSAPLKVYRWLLRKETKFLNTLPENAQQAKKALILTSKLYHLLCVNEWSVDYCSTQTVQLGLSKAETHYLKIIDGWSLCLADEKLPNDSGQSINSIATQMARDAIAEGTKKRGPGRTRKVDDVVEWLQAAYPNGVLNKGPKQIMRELSKIGQVDFGMTTLQTAISRMKKS
jgi:hypothetical protein